MRATQAGYFQPNPEALFALEERMIGLSDCELKTLFTQLISAIRDPLSSSVQDEFENLRSRAESMMRASQEKEASTDTDLTSIIYDLLVALTRYFPRNDREESANGESYFVDPIEMEPIFENDVLILSTGHIYNTNSATAFNGRDFIDPFTNLPLNSYDRAAVQEFKRATQPVAAAEIPHISPADALAFSFPETLGPLASKLAKYSQAKRLSGEEFKENGAKQLYDTLTLGYPDIDQVIGAIDAALRNQRHKETYFSVMPLRKSELESYYIQVKTVLDCHKINETRQLLALQAITPFDATSIIVLQTKLALYINQKIADGNQVKEDGAKALQAHLSDVNSIESLTACKAWLEQAMQNPSNGKTIFSAAFFRKGGGGLKRFYQEAVEVLANLQTSLHQQPRVS